MTRLLTLLVALLLIPAAAASAAEPPVLAAPEAIAIEATTGDVAFEKAADTRRPMASTTKLMTALLTLEQGHASLDKLVTAPRYDALPAESVINLQPGEKMTVADLLRALLMYSANDAAYTLAKEVGGTVPSFVRMMNRRAEELGLTNTHYANPIGLDDAGNYSTARDLATLTRTLRKDKFFRHTVNTTTFTLRSGAVTRTLDNRNNLLSDYPWVDGVKTGYTSQAGDVLVASGRKRGVPIISVVMGAESEAARDEQSVALLKYGASLFRVGRAVVAGRRLASIPIDHRAGAELPVVAGRTIRRVVRKGASFERDVQVPSEVAGPIDYGEEIGQVEISLDGELVARVPLTAALEVPEAGLGRRTQDFLTQPWMLVVLGAILVLASLVTRQRTPRSRRDRSAEEPAA